MRQTKDLHLESFSLTAMRFRQARLAAGYPTCASLAMAAWNNNPPPSERKVISGIECGSRTLTPEFAYKYIPLLKVSKEWLFGEPEPVSEKTINQSRVHFIENTVSEYVSVFLTMCGIKLVRPADNCDPVQSDTLISFAYALYEKDTLEAQGITPGDNSCWENLARQQFVVEVVFTDKSLKKDGYVMLIQGRRLLEKFYCNYHNMRLMAKDTHTWLKLNGKRQFTESYVREENYGTISRIFDSYPS